MIVNIFGIGDVLFSTPLISNLRKNYPNVKIGYVCNRRSAPVLQSNPKVDHLYIYERDEFYQIYKKSVFQFLMKLRSFLNEIKKERYDLVLDISLNTNINILCWLCGIKERVGLNYKNRSRFLTKKVNIKGFEGKHVIEYYLTLLDIIGCNIFERKMELFINQENKQVVDNMLNSKGLEKSKKLVGIVAGGGASWGKEAYSRRWSCEKFAKLADKLIENYQVQIILIGDKTEVDLCDKIAQLMQQRRRALDQKRRANRARERPVRATHRRLPLRVREAVPGDRLVAGEQPTLGAGGESTAAEELPGGVRWPTWRW